MKLYSSLHDIPLFNWERFGQTNDALFLINPSSDKFMDKAMRVFNSKHGAKLFTDEQISECYFDLQDQLLEMTDTKFDLEERAQLIKELMNARALLVDGDESQQNIINYYEFLLKEDDESDGTKTDVIKNRMIIQKIYGIAIDPKKTSVAEFIKITEIVKESTKKLTSKNDDNDATD
jgi:hypothetical protein